MDDITLKFGITDFVQQELGDIICIELPEMEHGYTRGDDWAPVESVKSASEIYCPVTGNSTEINMILEKSPGIINV